VKACIVVVDMIEDNFAQRGRREEERIVEPLAHFLRVCRKASIPIVFACDSFYEQDFIFRGRMRPHAIRGTEGTRPIMDLEVKKGDIVLEKRRFSAFFKTDLDQTLRTLGVDTVCVCGMNTHFCVLATAFDSLSHDFYTIILEDLCASFKREIHESCLNLYRYSAIYPLLRVMDSRAFLEEVGIV